MKPDEISQEVSAEREEVQRLSHLPTRGDKNHQEKGWEGAANEVTH